MRDGRAAGVSINVLYHPYTHAKARGRSPTYTLTYNTLNMTISRITEHFSYGFFMKADFVALARLWAPRAR